MIRILTNSALVLLLITGISSCNEKTKAEGEKEVATATVKATDYKVDTTTSVLNWVGKKPTGTHTGTIALSEGTIAVVDKNIQAGTFIVDMNTITVTDLKAGEGKESLESHLKGTAEEKEDHFFNVAKFPNGMFSITKIEGENGKVMVSGNLTLKDVTNNITFPATVSFPGNTMFLKSDAFTIDRTQWGVNYKSKSIFGDLGDKFVNDEIELTVELHAAM